MKYNDEIAGLTGKCEALEKDNENLERTLEECREELKSVKAKLTEYKNAIYEFKKDRELKSVKNFAEILKKKLFNFFQDNEELDGKISVGPLYVDIIGVEAKDGTIISLGLINELLKEYEE